MIWLIGKLRNHHLKINSWAFLLYYPVMSGHFPKGYSALLVCIVTITVEAERRSYSPYSGLGG